MTTRVAPGYTSRYKNPVPSAAVSSQLQTWRGICGGVAVGEGRCGMLPWGRTPKEEEEEDEDEEDEDDDDWESGGEAEVWG